VFGNVNNVDRGKSRLTILAVAYARFFLSDVLEVQESDLTVATLDPCPGYVNVNGGKYQQIKNTAQNFQTPVMDLSNVYGRNKRDNQLLKDPTYNDRLMFIHYDSSRQQDLSSVPIGYNQDPGMYATGSSFSNRDHFSNYIHSRFVHLHERFAELLGLDYANTPPSAIDVPFIFETARLFVVMVAENIARDLAGELGTLPAANFNIANGIPAEFLLMSFVDRFPVILKSYQEVASRYTNDVSICDPSTDLQYSLMLYNTTALKYTSGAQNADDMAWVGYAGMYTQARNGGFLTSALRCPNNYFGQLSKYAYDPIAAHIQRGRDNSFPTCAAYRSAKNLPPKSFADFGNDAFARAFAAAYSDNFAKVELSVCMLLDSELRDRMMGSLILAVLQAQASSNIQAQVSANYCNALSTTPVIRLLPSWDANQQKPVIGTNLQFLSNAVCRKTANAPKLSMRALSVIPTLIFPTSDSFGLRFPTYLSSTYNEAATDRYMICTTANPFLSSGARYVFQDPIIKELNNPQCDWNTRDVVGGQYLSNAPGCAYGTTEVRRCWCIGRDGCFDRGNNTGSACSCDRGYVPPSVATSGYAANSLCERHSYPQAVHLYDQFKQPGSSTCSATYVPDLGSSQTVVYCATPSCSVKDGHTLYGGCNGARSNEDVGRVGSKLGRLVPANYPNGMSPTPPPPTSNGLTFPTNTAPVPLNMLFRGMGKLLLDDIFATAQNKSFASDDGLRTGSDPSNPTEFKNMVTSWIDGSPIYRSPEPYATAGLTPGVAPLASSGSLDSTKLYPIADQDEKAMLAIFSRRHNDLMQRFRAATPCSDQTKCPPGALAQCVREIVILELRALASEFIKEAKNTQLWPAFPNWDPTIKFASDPGVVPIEAAAARLFDFHLVAPTPSAQAQCFSNTNVGVDPTTCITASAKVGLQTQTAISPPPTAVANLLNSVSDNIKAFGLGSYNSYRRKVGLTEIVYALQNNSLLNDIHNSKLEYAFNFGFIEDILAQDLLGTVDSANATCNALITGLSTDDYTAFNFGGVTSLTAFLVPAPSRTLCTLLKELAASGVLTPGGNNGINNNLHTNMFRASESACSVSPSCSCIA